MARLALFPIVSLTALALTGCSAPTPLVTAQAGAADGCAGVELLVDFANLGPSPIDTCVDIDAATSASDVLAAAGLTTEGTGDYGDAIVCRVAGDPEVSDAITTTTGSYSEDCADMPSADAYWSIWVRQGGAWDYAQVGFNELTLAPGEGLALSFNLNNTATAPSN